VEEKIHNREEWGRWKSRTGILLIATGILLLGIVDRAFSFPRIQFSSQLISQGELAVVKLGLKEGETPLVRWLDREVSMVPNDQKTTWCGFLAADLKAEPGRYPLLVKVLPGPWEQTFEMTVAKKDRGVRRLKLPKEKVDLDAATLERVKTEAGKCDQRFTSIPSLRRGPEGKPGHPCSGHESREGGFSGGSIFHGYLPRDRSWRRCSEHVLSSR
jgi:hypothetical protein